MPCWWGADLSLNMREEAETGRTGQFVDQHRLPTATPFRRNAFKLKSIEVKNLKSGCAVASLQSAHTRHRSHAISYPTRDRFCFHSKNVQMTPAAHWFCYVVDIFPNSPSGLCTGEEEGGFWKRNRKQGPVKGRLATLEELKREAKVGIQQVEFGKTAAKLLFSFRGCN